MIDQQNPGPLARLRVVELARVLAGPWAGQLLADLGADVIKVERPGEGDDTRHWGPPFVRGADDENLGAAYFHSCNRGKRSIVVDITTDAGQETVRSLAATADVFIENFKTGGLTRFGLDAPSLRALNPRLVYCSITGFGQDGPYAHRAGYDFIVQGLSGMMSISGEPDGPAQKGGVAYADILTGVYATVAVLAALQQRHLTGQGAHVDMALLDTLVGVLGNQAMNWMVSGQVPHRIGNGHPNLVPYQSFAAQDGEIIVAVGNDRQFAKLCETLGCDALSTNPSFATNAARVCNRAALIPILAQHVSTWKTGELAAALESRDVPSGPINTLDQAFADPQVVARGMKVSVNEKHATLPGLAGPIVFDGNRLTSTKAAPRLGEDDGAEWRDNGFP